jgi:hypothetical protein
MFLEVRLTFYSCGGLFFGFRADFPLSVYARGFYAPLIAPADSYILVIPCGIRLWLRYYHFRFGLIIYICEYKYIIIMIKIANTRLIINMKTISNTNIFSLLLLCLAAAILLVLLLPLFFIKK